jgi:hypothetical protein
MKTNNENHLSAAEEVFFGADGNESDFLAFNEDKGGYAKNYGAEGGEDVAVEQADFQRTFTLQIVNGNAFDVNINLFNAQVNVIAPAFGMPPVVTLRSLESNIATVYNSTMFMPLQIVGFRVESDSTVANYRTQLTTPIVVQKNDMYGATGLFRVPVNSYISLMQQIDYAVDVKPYRIDITGQTAITFNLLALQTVTFTFYTGTQLTPAHALHGRPALGVVSAPLPMSQSQPLTISESTLQKLSAAMKG